MSNDIYKPKPISGFPEWLPEIRIAEQECLDHIRSVFEKYGFSPIETPAVEELEVIEAKGGDADKEIYVIERLHKDENDKGEARLALHFDNTVPLARYVAQHFGDLVFPFKRYQIQKVWRGERPQAGRFREFYQCDIDVINVDSLPIYFDAEIPAIIWETLSSMPAMNGEKIQLRISNRKIMAGLCDSLKIDDITSITRIVDKLAKIGKKGVYDLLKEHGLDNNQIEMIIDLAMVKTANPAELVKATEQIDSETAQKGVEELTFVLSQLSHLPENAVIADLSIIRGLDYYTGTVYETFFVDNPDYGSICSGGRYDNLAGCYINKKLPGVGISIGFSRLFDKLRKSGKLDDSKKSPTDVLVVLPSEEMRKLAHETAITLRKRGFNVELYHSAQKLKKQLSYAEKKGIRYVWFPPFEEGQQHEVKDMDSGNQSKVIPESWIND